MSEIFTILFLLAFIALVVGFFSPKSVTFWLDEDERANAGRIDALLPYGILAIGMMVAGGLATPNEQDEQATSPNREEATVEAEADEQGAADPSGDDASNQIPGWCLSDDAASSVDQMDADQQSQVAQFCDALGQPNRDRPRIDHIAINTMFDPPRIVIRYAINDNLSEGMTRSGVQIDIRELLQVTQEDFKQADLSIAGTFAMQDQYGNVSEDKVVQADYNSETINRINFDNFLFERVYDIADELWLHPTFRD